MAKKLIDLYKEWMERGEIPNKGLCKCPLDDIYQKSLSEFKPTELDYETLDKEGKSIVYWGFDKKMSLSNDGLRGHPFTPLRQTIVLLICAMHDEL